MDRSAAYVAYNLAKNVASGLAESWIIKPLYAIGLAKTHLTYGDTVGTRNLDPAKTAKVISELMDLTQKGIHQHLALNRPNDACTSSDGHFGSSPKGDGDCSWESFYSTEAIKTSIQ